MPRCRPRCPFVPFIACAALLLAPCPLGALDLTAGDLDGDGRLTLEDLLPRPLIMEHFSGCVTDMFFVEVAHHFLRASLSASQV